jgi:hypothetical protein
MLRPAPELAERLAKRLTEKIAQADGHITSGFVGISYMLPILSDYGRVALCYDLILQDTYPSWGYSIVNGATTIWTLELLYQRERVADKGMNSFNHYSLARYPIGCNQYMGGIRLDEESPGYHHFYLQPHIDERMRFVDVSYDSISGKICSRWDYEPGKLTYRFTVPANTTATVLLPKLAPGAVAAFLKGKAELLKETPEAFVYRTGSGAYCAQITV